MLSHLICIPQKCGHDIAVSSPHFLAYYLNIRIILFQKLTDNEIVKKLSVSYGIQTFTAVSYRVPDEFTQHAHIVFQ